ncbi:MULTISPECIES: flagellar biosynthetic protein FliO [unclassified Bartonella]|uniref:flagellar biosynthetic protein FliO n=1 Tax=unclassified Bartonella TaxID=2645622 RepID=UPI000999229C|nr:MULTISPECIES: flagellar biosynthetic protein FliO [unclassified Bartonella]AQX27958.1 Flagellar biosynthesis protein, FliO [Bartonella sp. JB15]AQX29234.1 Flagellar biosynthesis protein, FliO [Bartonella sp. JB63]
MKGWLSNYIGVPTVQIMINFLYLMIIILAIAIVIKLLTNLNKIKFRTNSKYQPRLAICDVISIDRTHRLVLIRRDNQEHLVLIGGSTGIVVESNIVDKHTA